MSTTAKFIRADDVTHGALQQLAKEHKLSNTKLLAAMVEYFRVTKADPQQPTGPDLTSSLANITAKLADLDKRTIGFIREQEKQYLKPILAEVQAQKVLTAPAASTPTGPSEDQQRELVRWFIRVLLRGLEPTQLTPKFQAEAAQVGGQGEADPALKALKQALAGILVQAIRPELLTAALRPKPATPASGAAPASAPFPPNQPV